MIFFGVTSSTAVDAWLRTRICKETKGIFCHGSSSSGSDLTRRKIKNYSRSHQDTNHYLGNWTYLRRGGYSIAGYFDGSSIPPSHHHKYLPALCIGIVLRQSEMDIRTARASRRDTDERSRCHRWSRKSLAVPRRNRRCGRICLSRMACHSSSLLVLPSWCWMFVWSSGEWLRYQVVALLFFVIQMCSNKSLSLNSLASCFWNFPNLLTCDKHDRWQQSCDWDPAKEQSTWHIWVICCFFVSVWFTRLFGFTFAIWASSLLRFVKVLGSRIVKSIKTINFFNRPENSFCEVKLSLLLQNTCSLFYTDANFPEFSNTLEKFFTRFLS